MTTCDRCGGLMHLEWTAPSRFDRPVALAACYTCGERIDEQIALHRAFDSPRPKVISWEAARRWLALKREKEQHG